MGNNYSPLRERGRERERERERVKDGGNQVVFRVGKKLNQQDGGGGSWKMQHCFLYFFVKKCQAAEVPWADAEQCHWLLLPSYDN